MMMIKEINQYLTSSGLGISDSIITRVAVTVLVVSVLASSVQEDTHEDSNHSSNNQGNEPGITSSILLVALSVALELFFGVIEIVIEALVEAGVVSHDLEVKFVIVVASRDLSSVSHFNSIGGKGKGNVFGLVFELATRRGI